MCRHNERHSTDAAGCSQGPQRKGTINGRATPSTPDMHKANHRERIISSSKTIEGTKREDPYLSTTGKGYQSVCFHLLCRRFILKRGMRMCKQTRSKVYMYIIYICVYIQIYFQMYIYIYMYMCVYMGIFTIIFIYIYIQIFVFRFIFFLFIEIAYIYVDINKFGDFGISIYVYTQIFIHVQICIYIGIFIYIYIQIFIYIYISI